MKNQPTKQAKRVRPPRFRRLLGRSATKRDVIILQLESKRMHFGVYANELRGYHSPNEKKILHFSG